MQFSDVTNRNGIVEEIDDLLNTNAVSYPLTQKARNVNRRLDEAVAIILGADGRWEYDDSNHTDLPIGTATLIDGQQDYNIAGGTFIEVTRVEIRDINGNYVLLEPLDQRDIRSQALSEFQKNAARPRFYDKIGDSIFLYPKPSTALVTAAEGLKVYFKRVGSYFTAADTTKVPGFNPLFHRFLSYGAAFDHAMAKTLADKLAVIEPQLIKIENSMVSFYARRSHDEQVRLKMRREDYGSGRSSFNRRNSDKVAFY